MRTDLALGFIMVGLFLSNMPVECRQDAAIESIEADMRWVKNTLSIQESPTEGQLTLVDSKDQLDPGYSKTFEGESKSFLEKVKAIRQRWLFTEGMDASDAWRECCDLLHSEIMEGIEDEGEGEGEALTITSTPAIPNTVSISPGAKIMLPMPGIDYVWTLPPLDTTGMSVEEKWKKLFALEEEVGELEKRIELEGCLAIHYGRQNILLGSGTYSTVPQVCADQLWPIIESYVAARRAQVDALGEEIEK